MYIKENWNISKSDVFVDLLKRKCYLYTKVIKKYLQTHKNLSF